MPISGFVHRINLFLLLLLVLFTIFATSFKFDFFSLNKYFFEKLELTYLSLKDIDAFNNFDSNFEIDELVAHAGGAIDGLTYSNSLEALEKSYQNGFKFIEVDFEWTSDDKLVLIHDWNKSMERLFSAKPGRLSLSEFEDLKMVNNLTQISLSQLVDWLKDKPDVYIITDTSILNNIKILKEISLRALDYKSKFIPQIFSFSQYYKARKLGFDKIILSLYKRNYSTESLNKFIQQYPISAIALPVSIVDNVLVDGLDQLNTPIFVYSINNKNIFKYNRIYGIYTDFLIPNDL